MATAVATVSVLTVKRIGQLVVVVVVVVFVICMYVILQSMDKSRQNESLNSATCLLMDYHTTPEQVKHSRSSGAGGNKLSSPK